MYQKSGLSSTCVILKFGYFHDLIRVLAHMQQCDMLCVFCCAIAI